MKTYNTNHTRNFNLKWFTFAYQTAITVKAPSKHKKLKWFQWKIWNSRSSISIFGVGKDEGIEGQQWIGRASLPSIGQIYGAIEGTWQSYTFKLGLYSVCHFSVYYFYLLKQRHATNTWNWNIKFRFALTILTLFPVLLSFSNEK